MGGKMNGSNQFGKRSSYHTNHVLISLLWNLKAAVKIYAVSALAITMLLRCLTKQSKECAKQRS